MTASWSRACRYQATEDCNLPPAPDAVKPLNCKPDLVLKPSTPFTMPNPPPNDVYMCFGAPVTVSKKRYFGAAR